MEQSYIIVYTAPPIGKGQTQNSPNFTFNNCYLQSN